MLRLADLPKHPQSLVKHPALSQYGESLEQDIPLISLKKPLLTACPIPPDGVLDWLKDGWQNPRLAAEAIETRNALSHEGETVIERFEDDLGRNEQYKAWLSKRADWQINECPARDAQALYERLFALHSRLERESENFELMLGDGHFNWRIDEGGLHHPILLKRLELKFDPTIPAFTLEEADSPAELYTPLFSGNQFAGAPVGHWRQDVEKGELHPLGGKGFAEWLHGVVGSFLDGAYLEEEPSGEQDYPRIGRRAPVVFLRKRNLGYSAAIAQVLADIATATSFPQALLNIIGLFPPIEQPENDGDTVYANEDEDILLSKPANAQQLQIIRLLEKHHAVLVQGPPGTGKTHTIANILGHLLAQGQTVLVTSHSTKALRVLREQVVEALRPLCVSVLDSDLASRQQLETAIQTISEKLASGDARQFAREAETFAKQRLEILATLRKTRHSLQQTIANEYRDVVIGGEAVSPSKAGRFLAKGIGLDDWLPGPLVEGSVLPLSEEEIHALYASNGQLTEEDLRETAQPLPPLDEIWSPSHFERQCKDLAQLQAQQLPYRQELWANDETALAEDLPEQLRKTAQTLPDADQDNWRLAVIQAGMEGQLSSEVWESLCTGIEEVVRIAQSSASHRVRFDPQLTDKPTVDMQLQTLDKIVVHLQNGKTLRFWHWSSLRKQWRVDTGKPSHPDHFQALRDAALLQLKREALVRRWKRQMESVGAPTAEQFPNLEAQCGQYISHIRQCLEWHEREWSPLLKTLIASGLNWDKLMAEQAPLLSAYAKVETLRQIIQQQLPRIIESRHRRQRLRQLKADFSGYATQLEGMANEGYPVARLMLDALQSQDETAYAQAYTRLEQLHQLRPLAEQRAAFIAALQPVAPIWAQNLSQRRPPHDQADPAGKPLQAWLWRQYQEELERRNRQSVAELQQQIESLSERLRQLTANLIEKRAWGAVINSIEPLRRMALIGWLDIVSRIGKGMGKKVPGLQRQARLLMNDCRGTVPVWIMPFSGVVENFNPKEHRFDVLIIDESSQLDITGLLALYMAEKVIIVGDHEQVSPLDVGGDQTQVDNLINIYLQGIPLAQLYDPKTSVYHKARQSFGATVQLIEHFRCVPEVIQFSNHLAYDNKIKPLRESSDSKLKPATIAYQAEGMREGDKNITEAKTIVSLIQSAIEQPEYKDKSFGVITLLSMSVQAEKIESLLRERISPVEYEKRRIICGVPAQFQGDERDVIFLSMIDSPKVNGPLTLRQDGPDGRYKKRYNVAASRAKDQRKRSLPPAFSWERGHLGRHFSGRDARAPRGE